MRKWGGSLLLQDGGIRLLNAEHEVAEGTVDVLTSTLDGGTVGRVADVNGDRTSVDVVGGIQGLQVLVARDDEVGVCPSRLDDAPTGRVRWHRDGWQPWCPALVVPVVAVLLVVTHLL